MRSHSPHARRIGGILLPLALIGTLLSSGAISGQEDTPAALVASETPVLPTTIVTVLGDGFVSAPTLAPLRDSDCRASQAGPVERAASFTPGTVTNIDNRSCPEASLTSVASTQLDGIDAASSTVVIGGIGLEFGWNDLYDACLNHEQRSAPACLSEANLARATAANSFFSWRSVLQQAHRAAPDATLVVVAPPLPVGSDPLALGSECCGTSADAHAQIRGVFDTAGSLRRAVAESLPEIPIVVVETDVTFEGHRMDDDEPWLVHDSVTPGVPNEQGVAAIADRLEVLMPVGAPPVEVVNAPSETVLVLGTTSDDAPAVAALSTGAQDWLDRMALGDVNPSVAVVPMTTSAAPEAAVEDPPAEEPAAQEPPAEDHPIEPGDDHNQLANSPLQVEDDPVTTTTAVPETTTTTVAPETTTVAPETTTTVAPPVPTFSTTAAELEAQLRSIDTTAGVTSIADLTASLSVARDLLTPTVAYQDIVIVANAIDTSSITVEETTSLTDVATALPGSTTVIVDDAEKASALTQILSGTGVAVTVAGADQIADALPVPEAVPELLAVTTSATIQAVRGQAATVTAFLDTTRPAVAAISWAIDGQVIAVGQEATIPTAELAVGQYDLVVTATGPRESVTTTATIIVTSEGDGRLDGDGCPASFDVSFEDLDGDGRPASCDSDDDGDGLIDPIDPCPTERTDNLRDLDLDGLPDRCDGDLEDGPLADADLDGVANSVDNCPTKTQADQLDSDDDGIGDACEGQLSPACTIIGTEGNDRIRGTTGPDVICALGGDDVVTSLGGGDIVFGGDGDDRLNGGAESDRLYGGQGNDILYGNGDADLLIGGFGNDTIHGGFGPDTIFGDRGGDTLNGDDGDDVIIGGRGNDMINGGPGADTLAGGRGNDEVAGEEGNDLIDGGPGADIIGGGRGNDVIITVESFDVVRGGSETDIIDAAPIRVT